MSILIHVFQQRMELLWLISQSARIKRPPGYRIPTPRQPVMWQHIGKWHGCFEAMSRGKSTSELVAHRKTLERFFVNSHLQR